MLLPALYGGVHFSALDFGFASTIESRLWLWSGLYIALGLPVWEVVAWFLIVYQSTGILDSLLCMPGIHRAVTLGTRKIIGRLFLLGYTLARTYIIVESFVGLRHLPIGVYWVPDWLQMVPHI